MAFFFVSPWLQPSKWCQRNLSIATNVNLTVSYVAHVSTVSWICGATFPTAMTTNNMAVFLLQRCWKPQVKWQSEAGRSAPLGQTCCAGGSRNRGGEDGGVHVWGDILGLRRWWGCPCKLTLWPRSVNTYTHIHMFGGRNRQTGKKGAKTVYSSHSEPYNSQSKDTQIAASEKSGRRGLGVLWKSVLQSVMAS